MRRRPFAIVLCLLAGLLLASALTACGEEAKSEVVEGEPIEIGDLSYNIQITRFLNPADNEDAEYLVGQPTAPPGTAYLGVFLTIENETDVGRPSASGYTVVDTLDTRYESIESTSPYALEIGNEVPAGGALPLEDTTADTGPNEGALLIFHVDDTVSDNRPLKLEIQTDAGTGDVILDI